MLSIQVTLYFCKWHCVRKKLSKDSLYALFISQVTNWVTLNCIPLGVEISFICSRYTYMKHFSYSMWYLVTLDTVHLVLVTEVTKTHVGSLLQSPRACVYYLFLLRKNVKFREGTSAGKWQRPALTMSPLTQSPVFAQVLILLWNQETMVVIHAWCWLWAWECCYNHLTHLNSFKKSMPKFSLVVLIWILEPGVLVFFFF